MDRRMAVRAFGVRLAKLKKEIAELPVPEKLRIAAEFIEADDKHGREWALEIAKLVLAELQAGIA